MAHINMNNEEIYNMIYNAIDSAVRTAFCDIHEELDLKYGDVDPFDEVKINDGICTLAERVTRTVENQIKAERR